MKKLIGIFSLVGALGWTGLTLGLIFLAIMGHGLSDGPVSGSQHSQWLNILTVGGFWLFPLAAFVFMALISFDKLKGGWRVAGYWYAILILSALGILMFVFHKTFPILKTWGSELILLAIIFGVVFRSRPTHNGL